MPPTSSMRKRGQKREIVFDPEARKAYLRGFSERKRQRRAFGLAMQKVKDRKAKLEQRKQEKEDMLQQIEQAEKQKEELLEEIILSRDPSNVNKEDEGDDEVSESEHDSEHGGSKEKKSADVTQKTYDDQQTEAQWGGQVTVITAVIPLRDPTQNDDDLGEGGKKKSVDDEQKYAGNVQRFMKELKGKLPSKKKDHQHQKRKGKNGAADMKGMGGAANLKIAQKVLAKTQTKPKGADWRKKKTKGSKRRSG